MAYYSKGLLRILAGSYEHIYEGIPFLNYEIRNPWLIAEYKVDFDKALSSIGKGHWIGIKGFNLANYAGFGILQKMVIARIIGIDDYTLEGMGYIRVPQMRGLAFHLMADYLNGVPFHGTRTQFKPSPQKAMV